MMLKEIIGVLLLVGILQVFAFEKKDESFEFKGESLDLMKNEGVSNEQKKSSEEYNDFNKKKNKDYRKENKYQFEKDFKKEGKYQNEKYLKDYKKEGKYYHDKSYNKNGKYQFQKDQKKDYRKNNKQQYEKNYEQWKKHMKNEQLKESHDHYFAKENEIDSKEFIDKYNKYGKTFNPNSIDNGFKVEKEVYQEKKIGKLDKPHTMEHDLDVNYFNNHKKINDDSEIIDGNLGSIKNKEKYEENFQNKDKIYDKRFKKYFNGNLQKTELPAPPLKDEIQLARYIVHVVDWASVATLTTRNNASSLDPFVCVKAMSDGEIEKSSGVPMFYMSQLDLCADDLMKNDKISVLMSLVQTDYCKAKFLDPQDPRCAKVMMTGTIKWIEHGSADEKAAESALFSRHPAMKRWPTDHNWRFAKLNIQEVLLLHRFGGMSSLDLNEYLKANFSETPTFNDENKMMS